jgi:prepilin-type N-terminal cleavage/methylation domain-containing protein
MRIIKLMLRFFIGTQFLALKKTSKNGFTLIELLVTIAIIAIISVVAVALFGNIQQSARDSKRKAELESIANALEINKTSGGGNYNPIDNTDFGGNSYPGTVAGIASDPQGYPYCISVSSTVTVPGLPAGTAGWASGTTAAAMGCPSGSPTYAKLTGTAPANTTVSWRICTRLESGGGTNFCRTNNQ